MSRSSPSSHGPQSPVRLRPKVIVMPTPKVVRRRRLARWVAAAMALMLAGALLERVYLARFAPSAPEELAGVNDQEARILELTNSERERAGLATLKFSPRVTVIARSHSYDMAIRRYMAHNTPDGVTPSDRLRGVGIRFELLGENVFMEPRRDHTAMAERVVDGWLHSPPHRANLLSGAFREAGVGVAYDADGEAYVTMDLIR